MELEITTDEKEALTLIYQRDEAKITIGIGELFAIILNSTKRYGAFIKAMETAQRENFDGYYDKSLCDDEATQSVRKRLNGIFHRLCFEYLPYPINHFFYTGYSGMVSMGMTLEKVKYEKSYHNRPLPESRIFSQGVEECVREYTDLISGKKTRYSGYAPMVIRYEFIKNSSFTEVVTIGWDNDDLCSLPDYCMYLVLKNKIAVNKCQNCGKFFVPSSRSDEIYCDNIFKDGKTCKQIGYERKVNKDEYKKAYRTAYKTKNAAKNRKLKKSPTAEDDFKEWVSEAKKKLEKAKAGEITLEEFKRWLKEGNTNGKH